MLLRKIFQKIKYANQVFSDNQQYLRPGRYVLQESCRVFYRRGTSDMDRSFIQAPGSHWVTKVLLACLNGVGWFRVPAGKHNHKDGDCTVVYIANNHDAVREVKLFDFSRNRVTVLATGQQAKREKQTVYDTLHPVYPMPCVGDLDEAGGNRYTESMIQKAERPKAADFIPAICQAHSRQPELLPQLPETLRDCLEKPYDDRMENREVCEFLEELYQRVSQDVKNARTVQGLQHGDLSIHNLLYGYADGKEDFWWIDWEHLNVRPFYYDVFFFMVNSAVCEGEDTFTKAYLAGKYDVHLDKLFRAYGQTFLPEKRKEYLHLYMIDFTAERLCRKVSIGALDRYRSYVHQYF